MKKYILVLTLLKIILSSPSCIPGENFCTRCNQLTHLCISCQYDVLEPDDNGRCKGKGKCSMGKNYCDICDSTGTLCESCSRGLIPDENGACSLLNNCAISYRGECLKCKDDFILIGQDGGFKICKPVSIEDYFHCKTIDYSTGFCQECEEYYYLNSGDKRCTETKNCLESIYSQCTECNPGYYLDHSDNKSCKKIPDPKENSNFNYCKETEDGKKCSKCQDNYYFTENKKCTQFNFCLKARTYYCEKCDEGYYPSFDKTACITTDNCQEGDKDTGICDSCKQGYYLDLNDGQCKPNTEDDDLKYCKQFEKECLSCEYPYELGEDNRCSTTQNCAQSEFGICKKCSEKYYLGKDNKCSDVEHCIYSSKLSCEECEDGFYLNEYKKRCEEAEGDYIRCKRTDYRGVQCEECKDDYYMSFTNHTCYNNSEKGPFYKCAFPLYSGTECFKCIKGYYLGKFDKICSPVANCGISQDEICLKCEDYHCYNVKDNTCEDNYYIDNEEKKFLFGCKRTNKDATACEECEGNSTLTENGTCVNYYDCEEMEDGVCIKCKEYDDDYNYLCLNNEFGCIRSYNKINCLKCNDILNYNSCTECYDGFELNNYNICIEKE